MANIKTITKKLVNAGFSENKLILMTEKEIRETYKALKEESNMKDFVKYAAIGVAGYLVGFYEMKYKTAMALMKVLTEKNQEDSEEKEEEA